MPTVSERIARRVQSVSVPSDAETESDSGGLFSSSFGGSWNGILNRVIDGTHLLFDTEKIIACTEEGEINTSIPYSKKQQASDYVVASIDCNIRIDIEQIDSEPRFDTGNIEPLGLITPTSKNVLSDMIEFSSKKLVDVLKRKLMLLFFANLHFRHQTVCHP